MKQQQIYFISGIIAGSLVIYLVTKYLSNKYDLSLFDSPDKIGSGKGMDKQFLTMLKKAERYAGFTFTYNSGSVALIECSSKILGFFLSKRPKI